jgi:NADH-quinone oxidoreductase subunit A
MSELGYVLIFFIVGLLFCSIGVFVSHLSHLLSVKNKKTSDAKHSVYECGEETSGNAWVQFNMHFYTMGLIFIIFDVEILLLFPWSISLDKFSLLEYSQQWTLLAYTEGILFIFILGLGLVYIWHKDDINWLKPQPKVLNIETGIPAAEYDKFNEKYKV